MDMIKSLHIGSVPLGDCPRTAIPVHDTTEPRLIEEAKTLGVDFLEIRIDYFQSLDPAYVRSRVEELATVGLPMIGTIRSEAEGGEQPISPEERLSLFQVIIPLVDAVDIELGSETIREEVLGAARARKKVTIVSYHNFTATPPDADLGNMVSRAKALGADIVKLAVQPENKEDVLRLLDITRKYGEQHLITISLGEVGKLSRVFFPFVGSLITYTCLPAFSSASGQIPLREMLDALRLYYPSSP